MANRTANFSSNEITLLLDVVEKYKNIIEKFTQKIHTMSVFIIFLCNQLLVKLGLTLVKGRVKLELNQV